MIKKLKIVLALVLGLGASLGLATVALAADLNYSTDTTVSLSSPAINLTIKTGSAATTLVVNAGTIVVTVPSGSTFTVTSASRNLSASGGTATPTNVTCDSSLVATATITGGSPAEAITLTPTASQCTFSQPGGGGGGGGGSSAPAAPATPAVPATPATPETPAVPATPATPATPSANAAPAGAHDNGTLVLDGQTIYLIKDGKRLGFRNEQEYLSHGYKFAQAVPANDVDKSLTAETAVAKAMEGTLVLDASDGRTVYMIGTGGTKRGFASAEAFSQLGYSFAKLPKIDLSDYPAGAVIGTGSETHPDGALILDKTDGKTVWWIRGNTRQGFESEAVFNTYGFSFAKVVSGNDSDMTLGVGNSVKFRDGTLVKDGSDYYLISDAKKLKFTATPSSKGYNASLAVNASLANYEAGEVIE